MRLALFYSTQLICLLTFATPLVAAEATESGTDPEATEQSKSTTPESEKTKNKPTDGKTKPPEAEIFIPTEGISEDFAVSFPADI